MRIGHAFYKPFFKMKILLLRWNDDGDGNYETCILFIFNPFQNKGLAVIKYFTIINDSKSRIYVMVILFFSQSS
jgi:hypothetical protein